LAPLLIIRSVNALDALRFLHVETGKSSTRYLNWKSNKINGG